MSQLLYITSHPLTENRSYSLSTGKAFIEAYRQANPSDEIVHIDLYRDPIPMIDEDVMNGREKLNAGLPFNQLTDMEQSKLTRLNELADQFVEANKYVFVTPFWNLSYPPMLKAYLDAVSVAGKAFKYETGGRLVGMLADRKALHIQARGSFFSEKPFSDLEMGHRHLEVMMKFFGLPELEALILEGLARTEHDPKQIQASAVERAKQLALTF